MQKIYLNQSIKDGLHWFGNIGDKHISMRLAGKPAFLLEQYIKKYGDKEGKEKYKELLLMLKDIGDNNMSAFVLYVSDKK